MVHFVIAGKKQCLNFAHALYVADYLQKHLPNFTYTQIDVVPEDWRYWLEKTNRKYGWHAFNSPLIYKYLLGFGQKAHLIGNLSDFWEYCYDYYGLESVLSKEQLENLLKDNLEFFHKDPLDKKERTNVIIFGYNESLVILIPQLLELKSIQGTQGLSFIFYSENPEIYKNLIDYLIVENNVPAIATDNIDVLIKDCDLLLITYSLELNPLRVIIEMKYLAETINTFAKRSLKIMFACNGLSCLGATILLRNTRVAQKNIVLVSSDRGLPSLNLVAQSCNLTLEDFCGPPVWGFIGSNEFVDIGSCLKKCSVLKPYQRSIKSKDGSSLIQGTMATEFRFIKYMSDDIPNFTETLEENSEFTKKSLGRLPIYGKVNAIINLLDLWFSKKNSDEVISVGVASNESFGIPTGLVFSQPASLVNGIWEPFTDYPVSNIVLDKLADLIEDTKEFLKSCEKLVDFTTT